MTIRVWDFFPSLTTPEDNFQPFLLFSFTIWPANEKTQKMPLTSPIEEGDERRRSSSIAALMTLSCNLPNSNIPIINEPTATTTTTADCRKKAIRFDSNTFTNEYDSEEVRETKRKITDEIKKWVHYRIMLWIRTYAAWNESSKWILSQEWFARKIFPLPLRVLVGWHADELVWFKYRFC